MFAGRTLGPEHHAPDANRHRPAPGVRVSLDQKISQETLSLETIRKTRAGGARSNC